MAMIKLVLGVIGITKNTVIMLLISMGITKIRGVLNDCNVFEISWQFRGGDAPQKTNISGSTI